MDEAEYGWVVTLDGGAVGAENGNKINILKHLHFEKKWYRKIIQSNAVNRFQFYTKCHRNDISYPYRMPYPAKTIFHVQETFSFFSIVEEPHFHHT